MPIYDYVCEACGKRHSALLPSWSSPDPACPHCGASALRRQVSRIAAVRRSGGGLGDLGGGDGDFGGGDEDFGGGGDDFGGDEFGDDDY